MRPWRPPQGTARSVLAVVCAAAGAAVLVAAQAVPQQPAPAGQLPVFRGATDLVVVDAYPQRDGRIVEGLTPDDFEILEEGMPQKISAFEFVRVEPSPPEAARRDPNTLGEMATWLADPHRRAFVIYLDTIHTRVEGGALIRAPLVDMLNRRLAADDLFGVMVPSMRPSDLTFGSRSLSVEEQLTKYWTWGERDRLSPDPTDPIEQRLRSCFHKKQIIKDNVPQTVDWLVPDGPAVRFFDDILVERHRVDRTLTSLRDLVTYLGRVRNTRTAVLTISDGWVLDSVNRALENEPTRPPQDTRMQRAALALPMTSGRDEFAQCITDLGSVANLDNARAFRDLVTFANRTNVSVYPVATSGLAAIDTPMSERILSNPADRTQSMPGRDLNRLQGRVEALRTLAEQTDGIAIVGTNDLAGGIRRIVDDVSAYYLIGYSPTNAKADGRYRRIDVRMKPPGINIRARRGYVAETEAARAAAARAADASAARAAVGPSPIGEALAGLAKLQPTAPLFLYGAARTDALAVVVEVSSSEAAAGRWLTGATVRLSVTGANGQAAGSATASIEANVRSVMVAVPITLGAASPWRVVAKITGKDGSLEGESRIDLAAARQLVGAPIVYRATPSPRSPLRPVADMLFSRTERAHVEWPRLKAVDTTSARLLRRTGEPLAIPVAATVRDDPADAVVAADVNLAPLGAGDYLIELTATAAGVTEKYLVAFRVDR